MNIIKENLFFVVMGAVVLLALGLFVGLVQPLKSSNARLEAEVRDLVGELDRYVGQTVDPNKPEKVKLPNREALRLSQAFRGMYDNQLQSIEMQLSRMQLSETLPNLASHEKDAPGAFKSVYEKETAGLQKRLKDKHIDALPGAWQFWNWGENVPKDEIQRILSAKEFALTSELVSVIMFADLRVVQLDRVEVNPNEARTADYKPLAWGRTEKRIEPYFDVYPFVLEVRMPVDRYEILLRELLRPKDDPGRDVPLYIRSVSMTRIDDDPRLNKEIPPLYIGIRVEGWAVDYRRQEPRPAGMLPPRTR